MRSASPSARPASAQPDQPLQPRLRLDGVSKRWRKHDPPLLDGLNLDLPAAALALVVGENGVGKTTLLRIVAGIIAADGGRIEVDSLSPARNRRAYQRRIGFVSAGSVGLYARLSVAHHLELWARLAFVSPPERRASVDGALDRFELAPVAGRRTDRLSMGQRQRLRLALAFLHAPSLLVLDEPWTSLDASGVALLNGALTAFAAQGGSVLCCLPTGHDVRVPGVHVPYTLDAGRLERS